MNHIKSAKELNELVSASFNDALNGAKKELGKGCYRSRGKWIVVTKIDNSEPAIANGELEWKGTQKQLTDIIKEYMNADNISGIYIDGGVDYAESVKAFSEGWYDPWVAEYAVTIWNKEI